jgi:predicted O-linked N-acetylglucosamine transferase (SPINDLY family)
VSPALHRQVAEQRASIINQSVKALRKQCTFDFAGRDKPQRVKIGYISPDFRQHAVGLLIKDMFAYHDRDNFEVFAYSLVDVDDHVSQQIRHDCEHFIDVSKLSTQQAAQQVYDDGIDILIDLGGYTTYTRPEILALQPAPIQTSYLGYIDTMGADFIQHFIADDITVPAELAQDYTENILHLPGCFMPAAEMQIAERIFTRSECGLPEEATVFCSFNHPYKIDPQVFTAWMEILGKLPDSVLWLYAGSNSRVEHNLRQQAEQHNIDAHRLVFAEHLPPAEHLARLQLADLFLDTFIYNGGATTIGALSAGLPVLTLPGKTALARMGASIVSAAGLPELVCQDRDDYVSRAIALADDQPALRAHAQVLLSKMTQQSGLWDTAVLVHHLETAYQQLLS